MPNTHPPDSKQQDLQGAGHTATAGTLPSEAQASGKVSKASAQPVEQSLSARRAKSVFSVMERSAKRSSCPCCQYVYISPPCRDWASNLPAGHHTVLIQWQHDIVKHSEGCSYREA